LDLAEAIRILRRSIWPIAFTVIFASVAAFGISSIIAKQYESEARILVGSLTETSSDQLDGFARLAETYTSLSTTTPVLARVIDRLGLTVDPLELQRRVDVGTTGQGIVRIVATAGTPSEASQIANAVAEEISLFGARDAEDGAGNLVTIIQPGLSPLRPASPNIPLNTLLAAALGLVFGSGMVLLLGRGSIEDETAGGFTRRRSWFGSRQAVRPPAVDAGRSVSQPPTVPAAAQNPTSGPPAVAPSTGGVAQPGGTLATGVYVTGTASLEPGRRYGLAVDGPRLRIMGPLEVDPATVAVDRAVTDADASVVDGRLVIRGPKGKTGFVMAFMSLAGMSPAALAEVIGRAAADSNDRGATAR